MTGKHWAAYGVALGTFLIGLTTQVNSLHSWSEATSPAFVAGVLFQLGSVLVAALTDKPRSEDAQTRADDPPQEK